MQDVDAEDYYSCIASLKTQELKVLFPHTWRHPITSGSIISHLHYVAGYRYLLSSSFANRIELFSLVNPEVNPGVRDIHRHFQA